MVVWSEDELRRIDGTDELAIAPVRRNGELRRSTPIWRARRRRCVRPRRLRDRERLVRGRPRQRPGAHPRRRRRARRRRRGRRSVPARRCRCWLPLQVRSALREHRLRGGARCCRDRWAGHRRHVRRLALLARRVLRQRPDRRGDDARRPALPPRDRAPPGADRRHRRAHVNFRDDRARVRDRAVSRRRLG